MNIIKKIQKNSDYILNIVLVIGIIALVNFFAFNIFYNIDLTTNKIYSLSETSKKTIKNLDDVINVEIYFSKDLPAAFSNSKQEIKDVLDEYSKYSSNFKYSFVDPEENANLAELGIPKIQFNNYEKDKLQVVSGYIGAVIYYGEKKEVIPVIEGISSLEYQMTSLIKKITADSPLTIGFVQDIASQKSVLNNSAIAYQQLNNLYEIRMIDLTDENFNKDLDILIIPGTENTLTEKELKNIDNFLLNNGSVIVLQDGVITEQDSLFGLIGSDSKNNLNDLLEKYGITINKDLILDSSNAIAYFNNEKNSYNLNYPMWPKILNENFDQNNPLVSKLDNVVLPWASSLNIDKTKINSEAKISYLAKSTKKAWKQKDNFNLRLDQDFIPEKFEQYDLAFSLSGEFTSAFNEDKKGSGKLVVIGDSDFINDNFIKYNQGNLIFLQNIIDGMVLDEDLVSIRYKNIVERPLENLDENQKAYIRYGNIFGIALIALIFGLARYFVRRKNSKIEI